MSANIPASVAGVLSIIRLLWGKMELNLKTSFDAVYSNILKRAKDADKPGAGPGDGGPITMIEAGFEMSQGGWFTIVFDTRPKARPDGEWTMFIEDFMLEVPEWLKAGEYVCENALTVTGLDGKKVKLKVDACDELTTMIGELVKAAVIKARDEGVFGKLKLDPEAVISIEDFDGSYGSLAYFDPKRKGKPTHD